MDVLNVSMVVGYILVLLVCTLIGYTYGLARSKEQLADYFLERAAKEWSEAIVTLKQARRLKELYTDDDKQDDFK